MPMSEDRQVNPVSGVGAMTTEHASAVLVIGSLLLLVAIRRGFRGISVGGVRVGV